MSPRMARPANFLFVLWLLATSCQSASPSLLQRHDPRTASESATVAESTAPLSVEERARHVESFDRVWSAVRKMHFDPTFGGLDWDAQRREFRPKVEQAKSIEDVRGAMNAMIGRLGLSHFGVIPSTTYRALEDDDPDASSDSARGTDRGADPADAGTSRESSESDSEPGFDIRTIDGQVLVISVRSDAPAYELGVRPGWELLEIEGRPTRGLLHRLETSFADSTLRGLIYRRAVLRRLRGDVDTMVSAKFRADGNRQVELEIPLIARRGTHYRFGELEGHVWFESSTLESGVGYVHFNMFLGQDTVSRFQESIAEFRDQDAPGVIVDLRGNPGGIGFYAMAMAGWFFAPVGDDAATLELGNMIMRRAPLRFFVNPQLDPYLGPVAVLVDDCSASTSEILAGGLADLGRAQVFGTTSAGAALPSVIEQLPNGDAFQYAIANYISHGGQVLEGRGVIPAQRIETTREGLLAGRDEVIEAAEEWIRNGAKNSKDTGRE